MDNRPFCFLCEKENKPNPGLGIIATLCEDHVRRGICYEHYKQEQANRREREDKLLQVHKLFLEGKLVPNTNV